MLSQGYMESELAFILWTTLITLSNTVMTSAPLLMLMTELFKEDISWIPHEGIADPKGVSFESVN